MLKRVIERSLFDNPIVDKSKYPDNDNEMDFYEIKESLKYCHWNRVCVPKHVKDEDGKWHTEISFYMDADGGLFKERYIISSGFMMYEDEEERFINYLHDTFIHFPDKNVFQKFVADANKIYPDVHVKQADKYLYVNEALTLEHLYFASFKSGPREILFKSGLSDIAVSFDELYDVNIMGSNAEEILGVPFGMLKKLTREAVLVHMRIPDQRMLLRKAYLKYSSIMNDICSVNEYQILYLISCFNGKNVMDKEVLKELEYIFEVDVDYTEDYEDIYSKFIKYANYLSKCDDKECLRLFSKRILKDGYHFWPSIRSMEYYMNKRAYDKIFKELSEEYIQKYSFSKGKYEIVVPKGVQDILIAANQLHNCLATYIEKVANRDTVILFVKKKNNKNKIHVALEIKKCGIVQAHTIFNGEPDKEQSEFLDEFAKAKGIKGLSEYEREDIDYFALDIPEEVEVELPFR